MSSKRDLTDWVVESLTRLGGGAVLVDVARDIWRHHEGDLRTSGDLFYTWQYDMRWSANVLRRTGVMKSAELSPHGFWQLSGA